MKIILCIDDYPSRYNRLAQRSKLPVMVTCRMEDVTFYFKNYQVAGVCLDHDMPFGDGMMFANTFLIERNVPVVVSSHNTPAANRMVALLQEYDVSTIGIKAEDTDTWAVAALGWFEND